MQAPAYPGHRGGSGSHPDVTTVAGCDVKGRRVGYSSQRPGIPGMASAKPDIAGYTLFLGSRYAGAATPDDGTSAACPVVAIAPFDFGER
jgi:hypothetical protein